MIAIVEDRVTAGLDLSRLAEFVALTQNVRASEVNLDVRPLRGGLVATAVARVNARWVDRKGHQCGSTFVAKRLDGSARRETDLYRLLGKSRSLLAPRLLGVAEVGPTTSYLYLEYVRQRHSWPWRDLRPTGVVLTQLAALHTDDTDVALRAVAATWDYEAELDCQALATLEMFEKAVRTPQLAHLGATLRHCDVSCLRCLACGSSCLPSSHSGKQFCTATCTRVTWCCVREPARSNQYSSTGGAPESVHR